MSPPERMAQKQNRINIIGIIMAATHTRPPPQKQGIHLMPIYNLPGRGSDRRRHELRMTMNTTTHATAAERPALLDKAELPLVVSIVGGQPTKSDKRPPGRHNPAVVCSSLLPHSALASGEQSKDWPWLRRSRGSQSRGRGALCSLASSEPQLPNARRVGERERSVWHAPNHLPFRAMWSA